MTIPTGIIVAPLALGAGPLSVLVKDCIDIAGVPTRQGSGTLADTPAAAQHAEVIDRIIADPQ